MILAPPNFLSDRSCNDARSHLGDLEKNYPDINNGSISCRVFFCDEKRPQRLAARVESASVAAAARQQRQGVAPHPPPAHKPWLPSHRTPPSKAAARPLFVCSYQPQSIQMAKAAAKKSPAKSVKAASPVKASPKKVAKAKSPKKTKASPKKGAKKAGGKKVARTAAFVTLAPPQ